MCNKTRVNGSFNSPLSQAPKCLFQWEEQVISLTGVSSRKVGQRDIRKLFPQAQGPARGQASSPQDQGGMSRESRDQLRKPKDDASYGPVRRGKEITWSGSTNLHLAESIDTSRTDSLAAYQTRRRPLWRYQTRRRPLWRYPTARLCFQEI